MACGINLSHKAGNYGWYPGNSFTVQIASDMNTLTRQALKLDEENLLRITEGANLPVESSHLVTAFHKRIPKIVLQLELRNRTTLPIRLLFSQINGEGEQ